MQTETATAPAQLPLADRPTDLCGVRACAGALKPPVSPSTISRQLGAGLFKNWGTANQPLLSVAEVAQARAEKLNPAQQRQAPAKPAKQQDGYHSARAEKEQTAARLAALDLAERLGELLPRDQVEDAFADFGRSIRESLGQLIRSAVPELEDIVGVEAKIAHLNKKLEERLTALATEFETQGNGNGPQSP